MSKKVRKVNGRSVRRTNPYKGIIIKCDDMSSMEIEFTRGAGRGVVAGEVYAVSRSGASYRWKVIVRVSTYSSFHKEEIHDETEVTTNDMIPYSCLGDVIDLTFKEMLSRLNQELEVLNMSWEIEVL